MTTNVVMGVFVLMPFGAPVLMALGASSIARAIYALYSLFCHQLPERSWFLFGQQTSYPLSLFVEMVGSSNPLSLRQIVGNAEIGYKVAYSDRMVSLYTSIWAGGWLFAMLRKIVHPLPVILGMLLLVPMMLDGGTHLLSDIQGFGIGFRDTNIWLRALLGGLFAPEFYAGDAWGSFNSITRLWTGILAGMSIAWVVFPRLERVISVNEHRIA
jgi:uncharacterized membrane protein